jgi:carbon storage regulator
MLVLSRKGGEGIFIGKNIKVKVIEIKGKHVRLGIEAPADFSVYREEIYMKILSENRSAADPSSEKLTTFINSFKIEGG